MKNIVIIGNGISGVTAARHIRKKSDCSITIISGESEYFFSRTALMYIYMGHMTFEHTKPYEDSFWKKNRIDLIKGWVTEVNTSDKSLKLESGISINYDDLIIATGSKPNKFGWPGQDLKGVQGLYSLQDLEEMERNTSGNIERAVIVGGGLIGVEMAEMLITRNIPVTFLVRENRFWGGVLPKEDGELISRHIKEHHVDLRLETELKEILSDESGRVRSVMTNSGEEINCQFVGLTVGVSPNITFLEKTDIDIARGVKVNEFLETNIKNVYAIGDCAEFTSHPTGRRNIEQVWYTGRMMGEVVAETITGNRRAYAPGVWFNSAKFFDIEYQTYGVVHANPSDEELHFYWENSDGKISFRLAYNKHTKKILGVNVFGIRLKHAIVEDWIKRQKDIEFCMENLNTANFDPEFYKRYEVDIITKFNSEHQANVKQPKYGLLQKLFYQQS